MLIGTMLGYFAVVMAIGLIAERRTRDDDDFMLGGRRTGPWVAAVGAAASSSSAWTLLGVSGAAYAWGISALWLLPACVGGFALNWFFMAPAIRDFGHDEGATSVPDILGRNHPPTRIYAALLILASMSAYVAAQYQGAGKTFSVVFGVAPELAVLIGAAAVLAYTVLGGFVAVSLTDTVQGLVMAVTALFLPLAALVEVGGLTELAARLTILEEPGFLSLGGPRPPLIGAGFAAGLLGIGLGYPGQPHVVKYFLAMERRPGSISRARVIAMTWAVLVYGGMILLGLCGRALFPALADREIVLVKVAESVAHPILAGVMLSAVLAAIMSTADSQLLVAAGAVTSDLGIGKEAPKRTRLWIVRGTVLLLSLVAVTAALVGTEEIFSAVLFGWAAMGAGFAPGLILRVVLGRTVRAGAMATIVVAGSSLAVVGHLYASGDLRNLFIHVMPFTVAFGLGLVLSSKAAPSEEAATPASM
ncbi:MAG: sodium/proline symporter [Myxococcota bacterium]